MCLHLRGKWSQPTGTACPAFDSRSGVGEQPAYYHPNEWVQITNEKYRFTLNLWDVAYFGPSHDDREIIMQKVGTETIYLADKLCANACTTKMYNYECVQDRSCSCYCVEPTAAPPTFTDEKGAIKSSGYTYLSIPVPSLWSPTDNAADGAYLPITCHVTRAVKDYTTANFKHPISPKESDPGATFWPGYYVDGNGHSDHKRLQTFYVGYGRFKGGLRGRDAWETLCPTKFYNVLYGNTWRYDTDKKEWEPKQCFTNAQNYDDEETGCYDSYQVQCECWDTNPLVRNSTHNAILGRILPYTGNVWSAGTMYGVGISCPYRLQRPFPGPSRLTEYAGSEITVFRYNDRPPTQHNINNRGALCPKINIKNGSNMGWKSDKIISTAQWQKIIDGQILKTYTNTIVMYYDMLDTNPESCAVMCFTKFFYYNADVTPGRCNCVDSAAPSIDSMMYTTKVTNSDSFSGTSCRPMGLGSPTS